MKFTKHRTDWLVFWGAGFCQYQLLTWLEEHDGLEAGELGGVDGEGLEAAEDLLQEAKVQAGVAGFSLHAGAEVRQREQRAAVQRQRPLDGTEQEEFAPRLLQQDHLVGHEEEAEDEKHWNDSGVEKCSFVF